MPAPRPDRAGYGATVGRQPIPWAPESLADDFRELMFRFEDGGNRQKLSRWEGPTRVALMDAELEPYRPYVADLVARIDARTPLLDLSLADAAEGEIAVRIIPRETLAEFAPEALCVVTPGEHTVADFLAAARTGRRVGWRSDGVIERVTIFIPARATPQAIRKCLVEEISQALGPLNDIWLLDDSIFNDDGAHEELTAFDLLMLETLYSPELERGMHPVKARAAAERAIRRILGGAAGRERRFRSPQGDDFERTARQALEDGPAATASSLEAMVTAGLKLPEGDHRRGAALRMRANAETRRDDREARETDLRAAVAAFERGGGPDSVRLAAARVDLALLALLDKRDDEAERLAALAEPVLAANAQPLGLALALRMRALALARLGRTTEARPVAEQALDWAAYAFGADNGTLAIWRKDFKAFGIPGA